MHQRVVGRSLAAPGTRGPENSIRIDAMQQFRRQQFVTRPGLFAWLGAFAVVLLQLQLATHHNLEHDALADPGESCEVCLKLDASGKVPALAQPVIEAPLGEAVAVTADGLATPALRSWTRSARAPPLA